MDNGLWEVGQPVVGPSSAYSGVNCVGTDLDGNYPANANTRLISPYIALPEVSGNDKIQLKFWHWFRLNENYSGWTPQYDYCYVQISVDGGDWQDILSNINGWSPVWSQACVDLSQYADSTVRIAFYMNSGGAYEDNGWYIDDVEIAVGPVPFNSPENFENGVGDWSADNGLWEVGVPSMGPSTTHSGQNCIGTDLNANYPAYANTRLISPEINLPNISPNDKIQLKFWHWFRLNENYSGWTPQYDYCYVQISVDGGDWQNVLSNINGWSPVWSQACVDLSQYADSTVRIAFYMTSSGAYEDNGWYIDDVEIAVGPAPFNSPEDFENGIGDWGADNGLWEVEIPDTSSWPYLTHSGEKCAGTIINGNYQPYANTRLITPEVTLTPLLGQIPQLYFWHCFLTQDGSDIGQIEISVNGGGWQVLGGVSYSGTSLDWTQSARNLIAYSDSTVRLAFYFTSNGSGQYAGWFIDDVRIEGIEGVTQPPEISVVPDTLDFGEVAVGEQSNLPLMIYNSGDADLILSSLSPSDPAFTTDYNPADSVIVPDGSLEVSVTFRPIAEISYDEILTIMNNDQTVLMTLLGVGTSPPMVGIHMTPTNPPIIVPETGGSFDFNIEIQNWSPAPQSFDLWTQIELPGGSTIEVMAIPDLSLPGNIVVDRDRLQLVPDYAPAGTYIYHGYVGTYPWVVDSTDAFTFEKAGTDFVGSVGSLTDWLCTGESFDLWLTESEVETPDNYAITGTYPNPFNPTTTISYALPEAGKVSLMVYDISGRQVAKLVDGYRNAGTHSVQFDAQGLASGIYIYRMNVGSFHTTGKLVLMK